MIGLDLAADAFRRRSGEPPRPGALRCQPASPGQAGRTGCNTALRLVDRLLEAANQPLLGIGMGPAHRV